MAKGRPIEQGRAVARAGPYSVHCERCEARPGERCVAALNGTLPEGTVLSRPHVTRFLTAGADPLGGRSS